MAIVKEGIILENDNTLSFGDYIRADKLKVEDFKVNDDTYKVRTHKEVTRLSKDGTLVLETVPGATVHNFKVGDKIITFSMEGNGGTQVTLELEPGFHYSVYVDDVNLGKIKANLSGKINFSVELSERTQDIKIEKHL